MTPWTYTLGTAAHRAGFAWQARRTVRRLTRTGSTWEQTLATALGAALGAEAYPDAAAWMHRIEAMRHTLLNDKDTLSFQDYGVPHRLSASEAAAGRLVTRPVQAICLSSAPAHEARTLFHLIRRFRPGMCLELGTCLGISAAYQTAALTLNGAGHLVTLEGGEALTQRAEAHLTALGLGDRVTVVPGRFHDTLPDVLATYGPFHYAFLDGHHDPQATLDYYRTLRPYLAAQALLVLDDIAWSAGMRRAWKAIATDPAVSTAVDLLAFGLCLLR